MNVLSGAPFGYRYVRKSDDSAATYQVVDHEAVLVTELFRRYADDGASIAELTRWLTDSGVPTRTGKARWDRSVIWGMLRNPAYAGRASYGKTMRTPDQPGLNRRARLEGRATPRAVKTVDRPREEWTEIGVPAIVTEDTFERRILGRQNPHRHPSPPPRRGPRPPRPRHALPVGTQPHRRRRRRTQTLVVNSVGV